MSAPSIFSGPAGPQSVEAGAYGTDGPKGHEDTAGVIGLSFAEKTDQGADTAEYEFRGRNGPARLIDILYLYPAVEVIVSEFVHQDLLALALVNKEIHQILGQSTSKEYWKHLWGKCQQVKCESPSQNRPCTEAVHCIRCRKGFCFYQTGMWDMIEGAERRIREVCQECILIGRNPVLTDANLFPEHTLNQLTEARKWTLDCARADLITRDQYAELQLAQQRDKTFCPNRFDLFDLQRIPRNIDRWDPPSEVPVVTWQTTLRPSTYDPIFDRTRQHQSSRCVCVQAGFAIPLCLTCAQVGCYFDYQYGPFNRHNPGTCECGTMLFDIIDGEGTLVVAGHAWNPQKHSLLSPDTAVNAGEGGNQAEAAALEERIVGLCSWCGFRVYEQAEKGKLPGTEAEWQEYLVKRGLQDEEISSCGSSTSSEDTQME